MGESKLAKGIEKIVTASAKGIGTVEVAIDKILWGNPSPPRNRRTSASYGNKPAKEPKSYTTETVRPPQTANDVTAGASPAASGLAGGISAAPTQATTYTFSSVLGPDDTPPEDIRDTIVATANVPQKNIQYKKVTTRAERPKPGQRLVASGLFNALDALNSVDLCNVLSYAFQNINIKTQPRPPREKWTDAQVAFYTLQDQAALVRNAIDKYTAYPNTFIGSYLGVGPNAVPPQQAVSQSSAPIEGGTNVQKYNMYYLLQNIGEVFSFNTNTTGSIFTSEDVVLLNQVSGLGSNLNYVNDFLGQVNKYADYRQIPSAELVLLQQKIGQLRAVCVTISNLNFQSAATLAGNFLGIDIRSQVQRLNEFVDVTKLIPTLKEINNAIRAFIKIANRVQGVIATGQFIIKLAILLIKVFKFIFLFFKSLAIPSIFGTKGTDITLNDIAQKAKDETEGIVRILKSINALLSVAVGFIRYLTANANELLRRLDTLLITLEGCRAIQDSDILDQLKQTRTDLSNLLDQLATYVIDFDSKTDPDTAIFGTYEIRILEEEVVEITVDNRRRRGVALDKNGVVVVQSDLTFATNPEVIIGEVKLKLVSLGLVRPELTGIDLDSLTVINQSLTYLDNNDILSDDLNIDSADIDLPDNANENKGLGINAFINNLKGGRKLRRRTRKALAEQKAQLSSELGTTRTNATQAFTGQAAQRTSNVSR
jgi:hypothetical protein